tara:strand:+ start:286 stop:570 length:285 start_codon:yes stop_codon:yes gene_type:complete
MKKLKLILPMLAFVFAIALSFAFVNATADDFYATGYVIIEGQPYDVDTNCNSQSTSDCKVRIENLSGTFIVYDSETDEPLKSNAPIQTIDDPRP